MVSGYYHILMHPESMEYIAFVSPDGRYEFLSMPFGLKNAPSVFQRAVLKALGSLAHSFVIGYIDGTLKV